MSVVAALRNTSQTCSVSRALLCSRVFHTFRIALLTALLPLAAAAKDIRLRNELIHTPEKGDKSALTAQSQTAESPANGLFLIQFNGSINDAERA